MFIQTVASLVRHLYVHMTFDSIFVREGGVDGRYGKDETVIDLLVRLERLVHNFMQSHLISAFRKTAVTCWSEQ